MNIFSMFFVGTTVGLMALSTTTASVSDFNVETQPLVYTNAVNLGTAANFVVLSEWGISNTGVSEITGDIGVSPGTETAIRGFDLGFMDWGSSSTATNVLGKVYAANYKAPTPTTLTTAIIDMLNAYTDALGRVADVADLGNGNIGGITLPPGVYTWKSDVTIKEDITLNGDSEDVWIFQIGQNLDLNSNKKVILSGDAQAKNIFWQVTGGTTLGENSMFKGTILCKTNITMQRGAILDGRAMAQSRISLDTNTIR